MDDVITYPDLGEPDLIAAVLGDGDPESRIAALKELLRRGSPQAATLVPRLVRDPSIPGGLRTTAAVAAATEATPANERLLIDALTAVDPYVVAAAAKGLARIGAHDAYTALSALEPVRGGGSARAVRFARTLLSYRLGIGRHRIAEPSALLDPDPGQSVPLAVEPDVPEPDDALRARLRRELPALDLVVAGSVRFRCRGDRLWILPTQDLAADPAGRDLLAAVLLREADCPGGWQPAEYLLTHPRADGTAAAFGVTPGHTVHFGVLQTRDTRAHAHLRALDVPGVLALDLDVEITNAPTIAITAGATAPPTNRTNPPAHPTRTRTRR